MTFGSACEAMSVSPELPILNVRSHSEFRRERETFWENNQVIAPVPSMMMKSVSAYFWRIGFAAWYSGLR
jgi:hypothetical protein